MVAGVRITSNTTPESSSNTVNVWSSGPVAPPPPASAPLTVTCRCLLVRTESSTGAMVTTPVLLVPPAGISSTVLSLST